MIPNRKNINLEIVGNAKNGNPIALATEITHELTATCADTPSAAENKRRAELRLLNRIENIRYEIALKWLDELCEKFPGRFPQQKRVSRHRRKVSRDLRIRRR